jgi:hypothetical protein
MVVTSKEPSCLPVNVTSNAGQFGRTQITTLVTDSFGYTHTQSFFYEIMPSIATAWPK